MLEDNVRAPVESCADLVLQAEAASNALRERKGGECHFRFLGWLGSITNLEYLLCTHSRKRAVYPCATRKDGEGEDSTEITQQQNEKRVGVFPFPRLVHLEEDLQELGTESSNGDRRDGEDDENDSSPTDEKSSSTKHSKPGGNFM